MIDIPCMCYRNSRTLEETKNKTKIEEECMQHARKQRPGTNFPKIVKYKSPSHSKLNN